MEIPTPDEIKAAREEAGLTQEKAGELVYMNHRKRWNELERGVTRMHPAQWELFCIKVGLIKPARYVRPTA
jgi:DNA-binding XRE family transcriptional regulator